MTYIPGLIIEEDEAYETVGGFIMAELGRVADVGDTVDLDNGILEVRRTEGHRIERVKYMPEDSDLDQPMSTAKEDA